MTRTDPRQRHGLLVLNKPSGPTSTRCLERIKHTLGQRKIGHAGTLDPMAQGVLLVLLGQATKLAGYLQEGEKIYSGRMQLGVTTDTYDAEGAVVAEAPYEHIPPDQVRDSVLAWTEEREQTVPPYSAAKHQGKPLYKLSRAGMETPVKTKQLKVTLAEVLELDLPWVRFRVRCGVGTYVRSLVHSLGMRLGCGAVLTELTREYSHPFGLDQAYDLDPVLEEPEQLPDRVLPLDAALPHWPTVLLSDTEAAKVRNGVELEYAVHQMQDSSSPLPEGGRAVFVARNGSGEERQLLALAEVRLRDGAPVWSILRGLWSS